MAGGTHSDGGAAGGSTSDVSGVAGAVGSFFLQSVENSGNNTSSATSAIDGGDAGVRDSGGTAEVVLFGLPGGDVPNLACNSSMTLLYANPWF